MAVQRALECRDILAGIFETLPATYDEEIHTGTYEPWRLDLASAARVCRALSEPALAVLWRSLDDVEPVFSVLPSFTRQESGLAHEWFLTEEVTEDQWARMQWYANRVRELHGLDALKSMHSSAWAFLEGVRRNRPLMANLRYLNAVVSIEDPSGLMRMLSPSLREVHLSFAFTKALPSEPVAPIDASVVGSVFRVIPSKLPHLHELSVRGPSQSLSSSCLTSLRHFEQLRTLDMFSSQVAFDAGALAIVSQMSTLTVLEVEISLQASSSKVEELRFTNHFSSLTRIHIGGSLVDLVQFFAATRLKNLRELALTLRSTPSEQAIHDSFVRIMTDVSPSLTNVNLFFTHEQISPSASFVSSRVFEALIGFSELIELNVEFDSKRYAPLFDDEDAAAFATAWRELRSFRFWTGNLTRCRPTVSGLVEFARHCPLLEDIQLPSLDITSLPPCRPSRLSRGPLAGWSQTNLLAFASVLDRLFPNLAVPPSATAASFKSQARLPWDPSEPDSGYEP
ncbi:hypothetical protein C8T65DRAFT_669648, partial [Cerioporus squamosus]